MERYVHLPAFDLASDAFATLREMLVTGKRASERSARLVRRRGNVWSFLAVAPSERSKTWREDTPLTSTRAAQF